jgi:hypothetical protein
VDDLEFRLIPAGESRSVLWNPFPVHRMKPIKLPIGSARNLSGVAAKRRMREDRFSRRPAS